MKQANIESIAVYDIKNGVEMDHPLYGKGIVIASTSTGLVNLRFPDGHIEGCYDASSYFIPASVQNIETFKCPLTSERVTAQECQCAQDGIKACKYYYKDLIKQASCCTKEKEETVKEMKNMLTKTLKESKFEDIFSLDRTSNTDTAVRHLVTGVKGNIEKQVSDNAVLVNWKNQECPCKTVVTTTEIEKDNDASIMEKIQTLREKFKKKYIKPISDFFKSKKAALIEVDADRIIKQASKMSIAKKQSYVSVLQAQFKSKGIDVDTNSIELNASGEAIKYNVIKLSDDLISENVTDTAIKNITAELGYSGNVMKIYASLKAQVAAHTEGYKEEVIEDYSKDSELQTLF